MAPDPRPKASSTRPSTRQTRRWSLTNRRTRLSLLVVAFGVAILTVVGPISFSRKTGPAPVLPNTQQQFSLNLKVVGTMEHDVVYAVEQRARPAYRIFAFDPSSGIDTTVFTVPKDAIVYGIALSPDRNTLAVSYSPDFHINGSGLSLLNLKNKTLTELTPATTGKFEVNLEWSSDATSVYSTQVDQRTPVEQLDIARTSVRDGTVKIVARNGVNPTFSQNKLYYLGADGSRARRSIRTTDTSAAIPVGVGTLDLDHLLKGPNDSSLRVGVLTPKPVAAITVGTPAGAHGNHDVASTWWSVATKGAPNAAPVGLGPTVVYDASSRDASIVYATQEGLSIANGSTRTDLIASRAIRLVAA